MVSRGWKACGGTGRAAPRKAIPARPRRRWIGGSIAAALALTVLGALEDWPMLLRADYTTGVGERRSVALADGSHVTLDSGSAIAVDLSGARRHIRLLKGAALFTVAPDRAHPFTVEAAGGSALRWAPLLPCAKTMTGPRSW
jgi:transmembrane sensor